MSCFCFNGGKSKKQSERANRNRRNVETPTTSELPRVNPDAKVEKEDDSKTENPAVESNTLKLLEEKNWASAFNLEELASATGNFMDDSCLGKGGFGKVYRGVLQKTNQVVAIKQLDRNGQQGSREFLSEVSTLSQANHPNLVKLIGYCAEGTQKLLVYEFMPFGSLEHHLLDRPPGTEPLSWNIRMKIAAGAARGLEYLHEMNPPIIYRDLKSANILLGLGYHPKLSDFGLAREGPTGDKSHVSTRVMGTFGYCEPDYFMTGQLTFKSDVYSLGVVLLELITGRRAFDATRDRKEQNLIVWAKLRFKDRANFPLMVDPLLGGRYPKRGLHQALDIAAMCVQEKPAQRPDVKELVSALSYLENNPYDPVNEKI